MFDRELASLSRNDKPHCILSQLPQQPLQHRGLSRCRLAVQSQDPGEAQIVVREIAIEMTHVLVL